MQPPPNFTQTDPTQQGPVPNPPPPQAPPQDQSSVTVTAPNTQQMAQGDPMMQAAAVHHSRMADALNAVANHLGGSKTMHIVPNSDGSYDVHQMDATPGEKWGRIAAAALQGAAKGFAAGQGPGGGAKALAAGVQAGTDLSQQAQDKTLTLAEKMNDQNMKRKMFNANMAMMDQQLISSKFANEKNPIVFAQQVRDNNAKFALMMRDAGAVYTGSFKDQKEMAAHGMDPQNMQGHTGQDGMYAPIGTFNPDGTQLGFDGWVLPEDKRKQLNTKPIDMQTYIPDPQKPGSLKEGKLLHWDAGGISGEDLTATIKDEQNKEALYTNTGYSAANAAAETAIKKDLEPSEIAKNYGEAAGHKSDQQGTWSLVEQDGQPMLLNNKTREMSPAPGVGHFGTAAKAQAALDKRYGGIQKSIRFANAYEAAGAADPKKFTGPEDEALQDQYFNAIKPDSGFRMTQTQIDQLQNGRNWMQSVQGKAYHARYGVWFPPQQRQQIIQTMRDVAAANGLDAQGNYTPNAEIEPGTTLGSVVGGGTGGVQNPPPAATNPRGAAVQRPPGATMEYTDPQGSVTGWAVNGKFVARPPER
jgi:hypothetical protein